MGMSALCGAAAGLGFDMLRGLRLAARPGAIAAGITDMLFWAFSAALIWFFIMEYGGGRPRFFEAVGIGCGCILYFMTVSAAAVKIFYAVFENIFKFIGFILKILLTPGRFLYKIIYVYVGNIRGRNFNGERKCGNELEDKKSG